MIVGVPEQPGGKENIPRPERLIKDFNALLQKTLTFVQRVKGNVETPEQNLALVELADRTREAREAINDLHGILAEPFGGEGNRRIRRGAFQSYVLFKDAYNEARNAFNETGEDPGQGPDAA